jgi:hypothetical protein
MRSCVAGVVRIVVEEEASRPEAAAGGGGGGAPQATIRPRYSLYLLYWYNTTKTAAAKAQKS